MRFSSSILVQRRCLQPKFMDDNTYRVRVLLAHGETCGRCCFIGAVRVQHQYEKLFSVHLKEAFSFTVIGRCGQTRSHKALTWTSGDSETDIYTA